MRRQGRGGRGGGRRTYFPSIVESGASGEAWEDLQSGLVEEEEEAWSGRVADVPSEEEEADQPSSLIHFLQYQRVLIPIARGLGETVGHALLQTFQGLPFLWTFGPAGVCFMSSLWPMDHSYILQDARNSSEMLLVYQGLQLSQYYNNPPRQLYPPPQAEGMLRLNREMTRIFFRSMAARPLINEWGPGGAIRDSIIDVGYLNTQDINLFYPAIEPIQDRHPAELATPFVLRLDPPKVFRSNDQDLAHFTLEFLRGRQIYTPWVTEAGLIRHAIQIMLLAFATNPRFPWRPDQFRVKVTRDALHAPNTRTPRAQTPFLTYDLREEPY